MTGTQHERLGELCAELRLAAVPDLYVAAAQAAAARDASFGDITALSCRLRGVFASILRARVSLISRQTRRG